jgi:hypothetical protein
MRASTGGKAHRLAGIADRSAPAIADDGRRQSGTIAAIFRVDVLDHLLATLVLEIDVDIGRLATLGRNETLEQQIEARRVDRRHPEAVADRGVGRRAAALAEDAARPGEAHQILDGQEIGRVAKLGNEAKLVLEGAPHLGRQAARIAPARALPGEALQGRLGALARGPQLLGIFVAQLVQREGRVIGDCPALGQGPRVVAEQVGDILGPLQIALGIGLQAKTRLVDGHPLANAGDEIQKGLAFRGVHGDVAGRHQRHTAIFRQAGQSVEPPAVVAAVKGAGSKPDLIGKDIGEARQRRAKPGGEGRAVQRRRGQEDEALPLARGLDVLQIKLAVPLAGAPLAQGQEPAEPRIGGPVPGIAEHLRPVPGHQPGTHGKAEPCRLGRHMHAHDPGQRVALGDTDGLVAGLGCRRRQLLGMRGGAQEPVVAGHLELDIGANHHPKTPCRYQRPAAR